MEILEAGPPTKSKVIAVRLEAELMKKLSTIAKRAGLKPSSAARQIIKQFIDKQRVA